MAMTQPTLERLYHLLPAIYRQRDITQGEPLRALLAVMESELQAIEADIDGLYENWFIETCDEWVVPYMAELLGISSLGDQEGTRLSHRAYVANTIAYRRRKGVAAILEGITLDVTGWRSRVVEGFDTVSVTQSVNHVRPGKGSTLDIRHKTALNQLNSPFNAIVHTVDVRRIASAYPIRGQSNSLNLALFVWRLQSYPIQRRPAAPVESASAGRYTVHPLGWDMPLFNRPQTKTDITQRTKPIHLPTPLSIAALAADLQVYKAQYETIPPAQRPANSTFYGPDRSIHVFKNGQPIPPLDVVSLPLGDWQHPALETHQVGLDVERGRLVLIAPAPVELNYCYGFSADLGGGPYDRQATLANFAAPDLYAATIACRDLPTALAAWETQAQPKGAIRIADNGLYDARTANANADRAETPLTLTLATARQLTLEAADGNCPSLRASQIVITASDQGANLILNGLWLDGTLTLRGKLNLTLLHCTVLGGIEANAQAQVQVTIAHSIVGPLRLPDQTATLTLQDSIVDSRPAAATVAEKAEGFAIAAPASNAPGPHTTLERTTVFGQVTVGELPLASNVMFTAPVTVQRYQSGGLRFSYVPGESNTPPRYRCQPDLALANIEDESQLPQPLQLAPRFTAVTYGAPGYGQLSQQCAEELTAGADDGSEIGAFHLLHQPQRRAYLRLNLEEYVPSVLDIGIFYPT
jgi:hypothetical protein